MRLQLQLVHVVEQAARELSQRSRPARRGGRRCEAARAARRSRSGSRSALGCTGDAGAALARAADRQARGDDRRPARDRPQVGDFLLENDQSPVLHRSPTTGRVGRVNTTFGGTLVDADLQRVGGPTTHGNDQLAELLPGFVFTVIDPTDRSTRRPPTAADGSAGRGHGHRHRRRSVRDGRPAQHRASSVPAHARRSRRSTSSSPGKRYVDDRDDDQEHVDRRAPVPVPRSDAARRLLGFNIPGIANLQLSAPLGQLPLLGGEQDLFAPGVAGFNVRFAIEDSYKQAAGFPAFPGMVVDFLASRGPGVSYGLRCRRLARQLRQRVRDAAIPARTSRRTRCCCRSRTRA